MEKKFKPFDKVLVRDEAGQEWKSRQFDRYLNSSKYKYICQDNNGWAQCIPFEGNEHLHNTTDDYAPPFEPKDGDFIVVTSEDGKKWTAIFKAYKKVGGGIFCHVSYPTQPVGRLICDSGFTDHVTIRRATEDEKKQLLDALHEAGKDWDAEKKVIVDYKWIPKEEERVMEIYFDYEIVEFAVKESLYDGDLNREQFEKGMIFKLNDEQAVEKAEKMTEAIQNVK